MADFTIIETQEQLDAVLGDRLKRERETIEKKYGDYEDYKKRAGELDELLKTADAQKITIADLEKENKGYKSDLAKTRIALKHGLPPEMAGRLTGDDEEAIEKDAESLAKFVTSNQTPPPLASTEPPAQDKKTAALKQVLGEMKGEQ